MQSELFDSTHINGNDIDWCMPEAFPRLKDAKVLCIDLETCDPNLKTDGPGYVRGDGHIAGIAVGTDDGYRGYFPFGHERGASLDKEAVLRWARDQLCTPGQLKVGANLQYDLGWLRHEGVHVPGPYHCTHLTERLIDNNKWPSLERLSNKYVGESKVSTAMNEWCARAFGGDPSDQGGNIWRAPANVVGPYAEGDVDLPIKILPKQLALLEQYGLNRIYDIEMRLIPMLMDMRFRGVRVDVDKAHILGDELVSRIHRDQTALNDYAGFQVNVDSNEDLAKLFDKFGVAYTNTRTGQASFTQGFFNSCSHELSGMVATLRKWKKFQGTFLSGYIFDKEINGRLHPTFNQIGAKTGRFSSSNPNLQNVPSRDEELAPLVRSMFIPEPGEFWACLDYSQIEYRYLVHLGKDDVAKKLKEAYRNDPSTDVHQFVADLMSVDRKQGKNLNFGIVYGLGLKALANDIGRTAEETKLLKKEYANAFPFASSISQDTKRDADKHGYIRTISGRISRFDDWEPKDWGLSRTVKPTSDKALATEQWGHVRRAHTYRALNYRIQGSAADIIKKAMVDVYESGVCDVLGVPLLTVHDELDFSVPNTPEGEEALQEVKRIMEDVVKLSLPLVVDLERGPNWGEII